MYEHFPFTCQSIDVCEQGETHVLLSFGDW